jgi:aspartate racemase
MTEFREFWRSGNPPADIVKGAMKHIGILAHSAEGSALCYLTACHEGMRRLGPHMHPDITMDVVAMGASMAAWERLDLGVIRSTFAGSARRLAAAGCDFFVCPDNTAHLALEAPGAPFAVPGLHIAEVAADEAAARGFRSVGILGTKWTMDGALYPDAFARRGVGWKVPRPEDRGLIDRVIFDELVNGVFRAEARTDYARIIADLAETGCDAVVLGCTEIPLLLPPEASPLPTLDSTRLLAVAAVDVALGARPMPSWTGGPLPSARQDRAVRAG